MWSHIYLDYAFHRNFNVGFSSHKNDIHIHLSQWQYWWWFWFAAIWALYFFVILRCYNNKTESFNLTCNTSMRSHGKWGDFLVAIIPLSWCGNILVNSNFILRMIEWQNESSLFVIRIQGKQWYWVYKYGSDTNTRINNVFINVGNNNWLKSKNASYSLNTFNTQNALLQYIYDCEFKRIHRLQLKKDMVNKYYAKRNLTSTDTPLYSTPLISKSNRSEFLYFLNRLQYNIKAFKSRLNGFRRTDYGYFKNHAKNRVKSYDLDSKNVKYISGSRPKKKDDLYINSLKQTNASSIKKKVRIDGGPSMTVYFSPIKRIKVDLFKYLDSSAYSKRYDQNRVFVKSVSDDFFNSKMQGGRSFNMFLSSYANKSLFEADRLDDTWVSSENFRDRTEKFSIKIQKGVLNKVNIGTLKSATSMSNNLLFNYKLGNANTTTKLSHYEQFWGFRQKRYKKLRAHTFPQNNKYTNDFNLIVQNFLNKQEQNFNKYSAYAAFKNNKFKNELIPVTLARRLLRTKRTLVLPVHINMTLITNSYDVVHSWFVPGLGLKIDCVPGRSTHHSLYIENVGFYYGQCAEICGRYHHHMPIRVCALPYEHFILWWQTKGLPRMYRTPALTKNKTILLNKFKY